MTATAPIPLIAALQEAGRLRTRFAPSPTGWLHLGHAYSALCVWRAAGCDAGQFLLRIDDLDAGRVRAGYTAQLMDDLQWLGISWAEAPVFQSGRLSAYAAALARLQAQDLVYPCYLSRRQADALLTAPHTQDGAQLRPQPSTRGQMHDIQEQQKSQGRTAVWRLDAGRAAARAGALYWQDHNGTRHPVIAAEFGDVVLARRDSPASYHLSTVIDDADSDVTLVVRGLDLAPVTQIHRLLQAVLDLPSPLYLHHQLIRDTAGKRLAKRHDSLSLKQMRADGLTPPELRAALPPLPL